MVDKSQRPIAAFALRDDLALPGHDGAFTLTEASMVTNLSDASWQSYPGKTSSLPRTRRSIHIDRGTDG